MKSLRELYKIGRGPSSSHTMGPEKACLLFEKEYPNASSFRVTLYGSLAKTGKGHGTDTVIAKTLTKPVEIIFDEQSDVPHPNTLDISAIIDGEEAAKWRVFSIGGGAIRIDGEAFTESKDVYPHKNFAEIKEYCKAENLTLPEYVVRFEGTDIVSYLQKVWETMQLCIKSGLETGGILPGGLNIERKAKTLYLQDLNSEDPDTKENRLVCAYAFAVAEQNADGGVVVTSPTCGAAGILPAVLQYEKQKFNLKDSNVINALMTAGVIGNVVKTNASISGAECGCQAECGTACSMAAAAAAEIRHLDLDQIEYAAEVAMEHNLGLTCDPVGGLVQIPCIERNAVTAMRALSAMELATFLTPSHQVSFDTVVATMYETGKDINMRYRETSAGGLATVFIQKK